MKRLKLFIVLFAVATALPMAYVVVRTYEGLSQEESARMRFFADTLFDDIEAALAERVEIEENRPVDAYHHTQAPPAGREGLPQASPLASLPPEPYIVGYLQNNPDGSFQTPIAGTGRESSPETRRRVQQLQDINRLFNRRKAVIRSTPFPLPRVHADEERQKITETLAEKETAAFAGKFLDVSRKRTTDTYLGRKAERTEEISAQQALNVARRDQAPAAREQQEGGGYRAAKPAEQPPPPAPASAAPLPGADAVGVPDEAVPTESMPARFQVEVAPLQSVFIDADRIFIFRRIVIDGRIYRQGLILTVDPFLAYLADTYFATQPMSRFSRLQLEVADPTHPATTVQAGATVREAVFVLERRFPAPYDFLSARLTSEAIPPVASRQTLNIMMGVLAAVFLLGLGAIYRTAHAAVDLSERRNRFVSSVTHELKTPLTSIRMYIEMLEQGIAKDPAREQAYLRIVGSESARLSRLINNVLELSRLEKKQRRFDMRRGCFQDVLDEVQTVMGEKLRQEGFALTLGPSKETAFVYDREVMVQILINLIENSIKFGRRSEPKQIRIAVEEGADHVAVTVSDTGPGIPRHALKKIFDDFYRVEDPLTRSTGGTGIGLALVRKFMQAMGGTVAAANNAGPGCSITLRLPRA